MGAEWEERGSVGRGRRRWWTFGEEKWRNFYRIFLQLRERSAEMEDSTLGRNGKSFNGIGTCTGVLKWLGVIGFRVSFFIFFFFLDPKLARASSSDLG